MTDQELMTYAAQAIGCVYSEEFGILFEEEYGNAVETEWNPLEDRNDAFNLMIDLALRFEYFAIDPFTESGKSVCVITWAPGGANNRILETLTETGNDFGKVLRRAIVKAAAKIGQNQLHVS